MVVHRRYFSLAGTGQGQAGSPFATADIENRFDMVFVRDRLEGAERRFGTPWPLALHLFKNFEKVFHITSILCNVA